MIIYLLLVQFGLDGWGQTGPPPVPLSPSPLPGDAIAAALLPLRPSPAASVAAALCRCSAMPLSLESPSFLCRFRPRVLPVELARPRTLTLARATLLDLLGPVPSAATSATPHWTRLLHSPSSSRSSAPTLASSARPRLLELLPSSPRPLSSAEVRDGGGGLVMCLVV